MSEPIKVFALCYSADEDQPNAVLYRNVPALVEGQGERIGPNWSVREKAQAAIEHPGEPIRFGGATLRYLTVEEAT